MVSDRRVSDCGARFRPADKVFQNADMLAGAVGTYVTVRKLRKALADGARNPDEIISLVDEDSIVLCVYKGRLWEIDEDGAEMIPEKYHAVGAGADAALGFLKGAGGCAQLEACKDAVKWTFVSRTDCGDGVKVVKSE